ncbi:hypothetical protein [Okeania sp. SIO3B5]|nr:hypothetical protein [Okeania sp. SIO3B5]
MNENRYIFALLDKIKDRKISDRLPKISEALIYTGNDFNFIKK